MTTPTQIRIDSDIKTQANKIFALLGLDMSSAVNLFLHQCVIRGGLPFNVEIPNYNAETLAAIEEAKQIEKHLFGTVESTAFGKQYSSNTDKGTTSTSYSHFNMVGDAEPISKRKKSSGGFFRNLFKK